MPPAGFTTAVYTWPSDSAQTELGPSIWQVGPGVIVSWPDPVPEQSWLSVTVRRNVNAVFAVTCGAVKFAVAVFAPLNETEGPDV